MKKWLFFFCIVPTFIFAEETHKVGFGIGQKIGYSLFSPSLFTMRIRIKPSFYIAPEINMVMEKSSSRADSSKSSENLYGLEINGYFKPSGIAEAHLMAILGLGIEYYKTKDEYSYYYNKITKKEEKQTYALNIGLGYEKFLKPYLSINLNTFSTLSLIKTKTTEIEASISETTEYKGHTIDLNNLDYTLYLIWYI
jgi:hypothetical protein